MKRALCSLLALVAIAGCAGPSGAEPYIAFDRDFSDFRTWPRIAVGSAPLAWHDEGPRYVYRRPTPPMLSASGDAAVSGDASVEYPTGTIFVKTTESGAPETWRIFAMVKRGAGYNSEGARGWEFFELKIDPQNRVTIQARGVRLGVRYDMVNETEVTCNDCHGAARSTDSVLNGRTLP